MLRILGQLNIKIKLGFLILFFLGSQAMLTGISLYELKNNLLHERQQQINYIIETVQSTIKGLHERQIAGEISQEAAQTEAKNMIEAIRYGNDDYVMIFDTSYNMVKHPVNEKLNGKNLANLKDIDGVLIIKGLVDKALKGGQVQHYYKWPKAGFDAPVEKLSSASLFKPWGWVISTGVYLDDVAATFQEEMIHELIFISVLLLLTIAGVLVISHDISSAIKTLMVAMQNLSNGQKAQATPLQERADEVGEMAHAVEYFREQLIENEKLARRQHEEEAKQAERAQIIQKLAQNFDHGVNIALDSVASAAKQLDDTANSMSQTADQASSQASAVASASEQTSSNVQTVASASEELTASIQEVGQQVVTSTQIAQKATMKVETTHKTVENLSMMADRISKATALISEITDQTNMLALNATIEAARAGEAGKGFAVVASEVKELAIQTGNATDEIGAHVQAIQQVSRETVEAIDEINDVIQEMSHITTAISGAVEEQAAATNDIARNIEQAAMGTQEVTTNIIEVNHAANDTGTASKEVQSASSQLNHQSVNLKSIVDDFLNEVKSA